MCKGPEVGNSMMCSRHQKTHETRCRERVRVRHVGSSWACSRGTELGSDSRGSGTPLARSGKDVAKPNSRLPTGGAWARVKQGAWQGPCHTAGSESGWPGRGRQKEQREKGPAAHGFRG